MKRIAIIYPLYGAEASGSGAAYTRMIAERLANRYEVEVLTTKAIDGATWKDWYARNTETIHGVTVRRFPVEQERAEDFESFANAYMQEMEEGHVSTAKERIWFEKQGPCSPSCVRYIRRHRRDYDTFLFVGFDHYLTVYGLPEVGDRGILIPAAQDGPCLHFALCQSLFLKPRAFVFMSDAERKLVRRRFPKTEPIPCEVMGTGIDVPHHVDTRKFRRQYGLDTPYLLYVGKVDEKQDCPMLLRYFMEYKRRWDSPLKLVLMGKVQCRVPDHPDILPIGYVSEEEKYEGMAGAKLLLVPARQARIPISMLESMALSVPILANGSSEVLRNHCLQSNGGLYYQNYFEFEGALHYISDHPEVYMQMCTNAQTYIAENYSWDNILKKFDRLIARKT